MKSLPLSPYYRYFLLLGAFLLVVPAVVHAFLLMPFPASQNLDAIGLTYFLEQYLPLFRIAGALLLLGPIINGFVNGDRRQRLAMGTFAVFCITVTLLTGVALNPEKMFREPEALIFADATKNTVPLDAVVIGVEQGGAAKAYPVNYLGYHHKVQDNIGGVPVLITYCTICRSGRVYNPVIDGVRQTFRLVGARQFNAVLEDQQTKSWWYQASGEAATGPRKGSRLEDIPYEQVTLRSWLEAHPASLVMQPDTNFSGPYGVLKGYDHARWAEKDSVTGTTKLWEEGNWIVGIAVGTKAQAYEWNDLLRQRVINDMVDGTPVVLAVESDTLSYHAWKRTVDGTTLEFAADTTGRGVIDRATGSLWNWSGVCVQGPNAGRKLEPIQAHQEYWHAWRRFYPGTSQWKPS